MKQFIKELGTLILLIASTVPIGMGVISFLNMLGELCGNGNQNLNFINCGGDK